MVCKFCEVYDLEPNDNGFHVVAGGKSAIRCGFSITKHWRENIRKAADASRAGFSPPVARSEPRFVEGVRSHGYHGGRPKVKVSLASKLVACLRGQS